MRRLAWFAGCRWVMLVLLAAPLCRSQIIYNEARDKQAQEALKLSQEITSGQVFDKALGNLAELWKLRADGVFMGAHSSMRAYLGAFQTWDDIEAMRAAVESSLPLQDAGPDFQKELQKAKAKQDEAAAALASLKQKLTTNQSEETLRTVGEWMGRIGKVEPVAKFLIGLEKDPDAKKAQLEAVEKSAAALDSLAKLYTSFTVTVPASATQLYMEGRLRVLALEETHIENLVRIEARRQKELHDVRSLIAKVKTGVAAVKKNNPPASIEESLDKQTARFKTDPNGERDNFGDMLVTLYNAAALAARNDTPNRIASQRESMEERTHSLRRAAVNSEVFEQVIASGVQRLALYHRGGIKPETLASLIQALATVGITPAILAR